MCSANGAQKSRSCTATASGTAYIGSVKHSREVFDIQHTEVIEYGRPYSFITHFVVSHVVKQIRKEESKN